MYTGSALCLYVCVCVALLTYNEGPFARASCLGGKDRIVFRYECIVLLLVRPLFTVCLLIVRVDRDDRAVARENWGLMLSEVNTKEILSLAFGGCSRSIEFISDGNMRNDVLFLKCRRNIEFLRGFCISPS